MPRLKKDKEIATRGVLKTELGLVRTEFKTELGRTKTELKKDFRTELKTEIGMVRTELKTELGALERRVDQRFEAMDQRFKDMTHEIKEAAQEVKNHMTILVEDVRAEVGEPYQERLDLVAQKVDNHEQRIAALEN